MPFMCRLEDERGNPIEVLGDPDNLLVGLIPPISDEAFHCWRFIDLYGDTVFNRLQMPRFLHETEILSARHASLRDKEFLGELEQLARRCQNNVHLYLKFYGD